MIPTVSGAFFGQQLCPEGRVRGAEGRKEGGGNWSSLELLELRRFYSQPTAGPTSGWGRGELLCTGHSVCSPNPFAGKTSPFIKKFQQDFWQSYSNSIF